MSDEDDIFSLFEFEEEFARDKTGALQPTGRWIVINRSTGQPVGSPEASFDAAKNKARRLLAKRPPSSNEESPQEPSPKPDGSGGAGGFGIGGGKF